MLHCPYLSRLACSNLKITQTTLHKLDWCKPQAVELIVLVSHYAWPFQWHRIPTTLVTLQMWKVTTSGSSSGTCCLTTDIIHPLSNGKTGRKASSNLWNRTRWRSCGVERKTILLWRMRSCHGQWGNYNPIYNILRHLNRAAYNLTPNVTDTTTEGKF